MSTYKVLRTLKRQRHLTIPIFCCLALYLASRFRSFLPFKINGKVTRLKMSGAEHDAIVQRLEATKPTIELLRQVSGNAGISLGVLHRGNVVYRANFGYSDVEAKIVPDSDTIFPIASMTKAMVASALARLVDEDKIHWETKLSELVPEYKTPSERIKLPELATTANLVDILAHRLGLTQGNNFWSEKNQVVLIDKKETANIIGTFEPLTPFRSKFMYHNWAYGLAGEILENLTGESLDDHFQRTLFKPLGMSRTTLGVPDSDNYVKCYMALSNASPHKIPPTAYVNGKARAGAGACKSSLNDLLVLYNSWMEAGAAQNETNTTSSPGLPFRRVKDTWTPKIAINEKTGYGLGWAITSLPSQLGLLGVNGYECPELPVVARGTHPQQVIYHQGSVSGSLSAVYLLPESQSAIVVLGNSFDLTDTPDWISQLLLEALLDAPERTDFVGLAKKTAANALSHHEPTIRKLAEEQEKGTEARPLSEYCGRYYNELGNFFLEITELTDGLRMSPQGFENSSYLLHHYHHDVFSWPCDRDAESKEGLYPQPAIGLHKVSFYPDSVTNQIMQCNWQIDKAIPGGETFTKKKNSVL